MIDPHVCYTPGQVMKLASVPRQMVYDALGGDLRAVRRGRRWIVPGAAVIAWLESLGTQEGGVVASK